MIERGLYYANSNFAKMIKSVGGVWNDTKHRPIVCLIKSTENDELYWAIPMGKYNHRNSEQIERLNKFLNLPEKDIRSCYYHIGRTTSTSIFFISDAIPITDKYILEEHLGHDKKHFVIKNHITINIIIINMHYIQSPLSNIIHIMLYISDTASDRKALL